MDDVHAIERLRDELSKDVDKLERQLKPLQESLGKQKERLAVTERLLALMQTGSSNGHSQVSTVGVDVPTASRGSENGDFAPTHVYWPAILHALEKLGGRGRSEQVTDIVGDLIKEILKPADYERLPSGVIRWRNRVAWQRLNMINEGLLRNDSPRGIWEWTDKGRTWITAGSGGFRGLA